jgi:hypothetical protein
MPADVEMNWMGSESGQNAEPIEGGGILDK